MAGSYFDAKVEVHELEHWLDEYGGRARDPGPVLAVIAEDLVAAVSDNYDSSGGGAWPPLKVRSGKPLLDTGRAAGSTSASSGSDFAEASSNVDYLKFHLDGGRVIPKRNPFELEDDVWIDANDALLDYVLEGHL